MLRKLLGSIWQRSQDSSGVINAWKSPLRILSSVFRTEWSHHVQCCCTRALYRHHHSDLLTCHSDLMNILLLTKSQSLPVMRDSTLQHAMLLPHISRHRRCSSTFHHSLVKERHGHRRFFPTLPVCSCPTPHLAIVWSVDVEEQATKGLERTIWYSKGI